MKHTAALVIVVTIAGAPVSTLACVARCVPVSAACHHQNPAAAAIAGGDDACARLLATSPFVTEDTRLTSRAAMPAGAPHASLARAAGEAQLAVVRDVGATLRHPSISALVLRL